MTENRSTLDTAIENALFDVVTDVLGGVIRSAINTSLEAIKTELIDNIKEEIEEALK